MEPSDISVEQAKQRRLLSKLCFILIIPLSLLFLWTWIIQQSSEPMVSLASSIQVTDISSGAGEQISTVVGVSVAIALAILGVPLVFVVSGGFLAWWFLSTFLLGS